MTFIKTFRPVFITALALALLLSGAPAYAHGDGEDDLARGHDDAPAVVPARDGIDRAELHDRVEAAREEREDTIHEEQHDRRQDVPARDGIDRTELHDRVEAAREEREDTIHERREAVREEQHDRRQDVLHRVSDRLFNHIDRFATILGAAIERIQGFIERLEARADILDEAGADTSAARELLEEARVELDVTLLDLELISNEVGAVITDDAELSPELLRTEFAKIREAIQSAKENIRSAFALIRDAFAALREAAAGIRDIDDDNE